MPAFDLRNALYLDGVIIAGPGGLRGNAPNPAGGGGGPTVPITFESGMHWSSPNTATCTSTGTLVTTVANSYLFAVLAMARAAVRASYVCTRVASTSSLEFSQLAALGGIMVGNEHYQLELWGAPSAGTLAGETVVFHLSGVNAAAACMVAAFNGIVGTSGIYTPDGLLQSNFNPSGAPSVVLNTTGTNDLLLFMASGTPSSNSTPPDGTWTITTAAQTGSGGSGDSVRLGLSHKIVSTAQTALTVTPGPSGTFPPGRGLCIGLALRGM